MTMPLDEGGTTLVLTTGQLPSDATVQLWVERALADAPEVVVAHVALIAYELVAGASKYGTGPFVVGLSVLDSGYTVLVFVETCTSDGSGAAGVAGDQSLVVVAALSTRWGIELRRRARAVWAELGVETPVTLSTELD